MKQLNENDYRWDNELSYCENIVAQFKWCRQNHISISEELSESYDVCLGNLQSEDAERRYLNGD